LYINTPSPHERSIPGATIRLVIFTVPSGACAETNEMFDSAIFAANRNASSAIDVRAIVFLGLQALMSTAFVRAPESFHNDVARRSSIASSQSTSFF
jgi:hypothetical protein